MKPFIVAPIVAVALALRVWLSRTRRRRRAEGDRAADARRPARRLGSRSASSDRRARWWRAREDSLGAVGMVAVREIRERIRGRIFRIGTLVLLVAVAAAIVIPTLQSGGGPTTQRVGVVGGLSLQARQFVRAAGARNQDSVTFVPQRSVEAARAALRSGRVDLAIVDADQMLLDRPAGSKSSPADPALVQDTAEYLGVRTAYRAAGLSPAQVSTLQAARPVPVHSLRSGSTGTVKATSVIGLVLLFFLLNQYDTWILMGVMQEKSSRVVEVLLATVRPIQLLGGKVLGIGLVALGQVAIVVGFALALGAAVGSDLLHGTAPLVLVCQLLWLVLGYGFYCWVYAAAGSTGERQDQVQTLALPLSIPVLVGYIFSITVATSGDTDLLFKVLAYLPPTAPFCMPVLVALNQVTWWEFVASALISVAGTVAMAIFAARVYRRAVLRTGGRVSVRRLVGRAAR